MSLVELSCVNTGTLNMGKSLKLESLYVGKDLPSQFYLHDLKPNYLLNRPQDLQMRHCDIYMQHLRND